MLPKIIHYCWFGKKPLPPLVSRCIESWVEYCPDFEIRRWDETNSPIDHPVVRRALVDQLWAYAADYVRLHALAEYGGIYLDTDIELIKSLDELAVLDGFSAFERPGFVANGVLAAQPGNVVIENCKDVMTRFVQMRKPFPTGPRVLTAELTDMKGAPLVFGDTVSGIKLLSPKSFYPYNPYDVSQNVKTFMYGDIVDETFGVHHWEKSWKKTGWDRLRLALRQRLRRYSLMG